MRQPLEKRENWIKGRREKRKQARQARVRRQVFRYALLAVMVCVGIGGFTQISWRLNDPLNQIEIHGNHVVSDEQIRQAIMPSISGPVFRMDPAELEKTLCKLPAVRYAFVRRYALPTPRVKVEVLEEFPWATYSVDPESPPVAVIAQTGRVIPIDEFPSVVKPPLRISGASALKMTAAQIAQWDAWVRLSEAQVGVPVKCVDLRQPAAITIACGDIELHVGQADSTLERRLKRLVSVVPVATTFSDKLRFIDLSLESNIPLKVDRHQSTAPREDELLRQALQTTPAVAESTAPAPPM